jgi:hypothetical protein
MHSLSDYHFETEVEAIAFATQQRANKCPSEDKYVTGPIYMDEEVILKDITWTTSKAKWWQVTVESFS